MFEQRIGLKYLVKNVIGFVNDATLRAQSAVYFLAGHSRAGLNSPFMVNACSRRRQLLVLWLLSLSIFKES